jgi:hypothetical protein
MTCGPLAPFALSLSKGLPSCSAREGEGFDRLSPNGWCDTNMEMI